MDYIEIESIEEAGDSETYDIWNYDPDCQDADGGNFFIDGVLVHNSIPEAVANRDDPTESWKNRLAEVHPALLDILEDTYGVICWQEQLAAIWQRIGGFTAPEAQDARKAVAKKWTHKLKPIKQKWMTGASRVIGEDNAAKYWALMETFGRYAFNKCLCGDTVLRDANTNVSKTVAEWHADGDALNLSLESYTDGTVVVDECKAIHYNGVQQVVEVQFTGGGRERVTLDHRFLCTDGLFHTVRYIVSNYCDIVTVSGTTRIKALIAIGTRDTFSPEMSREQHNYITAQSGVIHKNSHGVSYCLVAYRSLFLKRHFSSEFWASILSGCDTKNVPRYMGIIRSEKWVPTNITAHGHHHELSEPIGTIDINNLALKFTVSGNTINQGLVGIKGIGEAMANEFVGTGNYASIDDFIEKNSSKKIVLERFIKLGAFCHLPGHESRYAIWQWYLYKYGSGKDITKLRKEVRAKLIELEGWNEKTIKEEIERQTANYFKAYPNRKKVPAKITNWKPTPNDSRENVVALFKDQEFSVEEILNFELEYFGYHVSSPLDLYIIGGDGMICDAKNESGRPSKLEVVISSVEISKTKTGSKYARLIVTDGVENALVLLWSNEIDNTDQSILKEGVGVVMWVRYDEQRGTFTLARNETVMKLIRRQDANAR